MKTTVAPRRHARRGPRIPAIGAALAALLAFGCASSPPGVGRPGAAPAASATTIDDGQSSGVVYTERSANGRPVDVLIVFDADGRLIGTRSTALAGAE